MPSHLGAQISKSNKLEIHGLDRNQVLKGWNGSSLTRIFALATLSLETLKKINQEWKCGSERALVWLVTVFSSTMGKREIAEGVWGYLYPHTLKTIRW